MEISEHLPFVGWDRETLEELYAWTYHDAVFEQDLWLTEYPITGPICRGPFERWQEAQRLRTLAEAFQAGDKTVLFEALSICAYNSFPMPKWIADAILSGAVAIKLYALAAWDDIFGAMYPKGTHVRASGDKLQQAGLVSRRVREIVEETGCPIDSNLFERIGRETGIGGKTKISDIYYYEKKLLQDYTDDGPPVISSPEE